MFDIITFGSAVVDVFVDTETSARKGNICYPLGSKILIEDLRFDVGGGGTNTAVAFSRLGFRTGFVGKIGEDSEGDRVLNVLKKENVKFLGKATSFSITGYSIVLDSLSHDRTILTYKGINDELRAGEISFKNLETKWLYLSSLLGESFKTQKNLVNYLHKKGTKIAFNPSEYAIKVLDLKPILKYTEILILNKEEAELLCKKNGVREKDLLKGLNSLGSKIVVITNKDKEVLAYDGIRKYSLMPHKVKAIERTGAGDAFASGFVAGQMAGKSIEQSLKLGLEESESVIRHKGAKVGLIRRRLG